MKRVKLLFVVISMFLLTGCVQKYEYSEAQSDGVAEYIAGLILENDEGYTQKLMTIDELSGDAASDDNTDNEDSTAPTSTSDNDKENVSISEEESKKEYTLAEVLGMKYFDLQYSGYEILDTYPEDKSLEYFSITPREGNQLVVISFKLANTTKKDKTVDLSKTKVAYQLDINNGTIYEPSFTVLENDLKYLKASFDKGEELPVVLVVEISKESEIKDMNLTISNGDKTNIIKMK